MIPKHDAPDADRDVRHPRDAASAPPAPDAPPVQEYPKMLYHDGQQLVVQNADQEAAATKDGYTATPTAPEAAKKDAAR